MMKTDTFIKNSVSPRPLRRGPLMHLMRFVSRILLLIFLMMVTPTRAFAAPHFTLSPASTTINNGGSVQVNILIDVESNAVFGADAVFTIPTSDIDITNVTNGGFFTDFNYAADTSHNRLEIHGFFSALYQSKSGTGTFATMTMKAKQGSGNDTIAFVCDGTSTGSQILDSNGQNVLNCANVNALAVTFTGAAPGTTPTPTPTPTPTSTPQPTATPGPSTNTPDPTCDGLAVSPTSGKKPLPVTLVCTGESQRSDVNAAEFNFGDGQVQLVEKNVGSFGSISTTHTYDAAGTYNPTCRLRDNNQRFSQTPDACRKTVTVSATAAMVRRTVSTQPQIVELVPYVPASAPAEIITPIPTFAPAPAEESNPWSRYFLGGGIIAFSLLFGLWLIGKSRGPKPPTPPPPAPAPPAEEYMPRTENLPPVEEIPPVTESTELQSQTDESQPL